MSKAGCRTRAERRRGAILRLAGALLLVALTASIAPAGESSPGEPDGYRLDDYRGGTPSTVLGRAAIDTDEAHRLWREQAAAFIDVLPAPRRPDNLPATALWAPRPHRSIPRSVWLPDVGRGALDPALEAQFRKVLDQATRGDRTAGLVFYCLADCWMSWNATRRALEWGYQGAKWYRDGTDGWSAAGFPLAEVKPWPEAG